MKLSMIYGLSDITRNLVGRSSKSENLRKKEFWAVNDVSFELKRGETLGIIGPNGSGKSTLLKMLNGIYWPDKGKITVNGRVGALIEVGAGFHPMLTGRENIYINGAILGMSKQEIAGKFEQIVAFADIGEFLDTPVKNYSSGMFVRLGFSIAAHCDPDILLIDEVLAVGDTGFRARCYDKIAELKKKSAIILVSHNMSAIGRVTNQCLVIHQGNLQYLGEPGKAIQNYLALFHKAEENQHQVAGTGEANISNFQVLDQNGAAQTAFEFGETVSIEFDLEVSKLYPQVMISLGFFDSESQYIAQCHSRYNKFKIENTNKKQKISIKIPQLPLNPGDYTMSIIIFDRDHARYLTWHDRAYRIRVKGDFFGGANVQFNALWSSRQY